MCGRARCAVTHETIISASKGCNWVDKELFIPLENLTPRKYVPVMVRSDSSKILRSLVWGLIPSFTKHNATPDHFKMHNARVESIHVKPSFRNLVDSRRCVVFVDGYYEWRSEGGSKQPYFMHFKDNRLIAVAGVYDVWLRTVNNTQIQVVTCSMITGPANQFIQNIHTRQPVMLSTDSLIDKWLDPNITYADIVKLIDIPYPHADLIYHAVDKRMSTGTYQGADCAQPVAMTPTIRSFFS